MSWLWILLLKYRVDIFFDFLIARLAQSAEREAFNLVVVGSIPTVGAIIASSHFTCEVLRCTVVKDWNLPFVLLGMSGHSAPPAQHLSCIV